MISYITLPSDNPTIKIQDIFLIDNAVLDYIIFHIYKVNEIIDLTGLDNISVIPHGNSRGMYCQTKNGRRWIELYSNTKSFSPNYRGHKYKTFGGIKDLTPGGVLAHEFSHHISFLNISLFKSFKKIRKSSKCFTSYGQSRLGEDIAETGRLYFSNPEKLKEIDLQRYEAFHYIGRSYLRNSPSYL